MIGGLITPPVFDNQEQNERARNLHYVAWVIVVATTIGLVGIAAAQTELAVWALTRLAVVLGLALVGLVLNHQGKTHLASLLLVGGLIAFVTMNSFFVGGIRSPGVTLYFLFVLMAGLLLGEVAGIMTAVGCALLGLGLIVSEGLGFLPEPTVHYNAVSLWLLNCIYMGVVIILLRLATRTIRNALRRAETELADRKRAERERERAEQRHEALETQLRQSQKMEALGTLAGGVAHDFNNLLGAIQGFAQLITSDLRPGFPPHNFAQRILAACDRGKELVEQILAFAHGGNLQRSVVNLSLLLQECEALVSATLPKSVHLSVIQPEEELRAWVHRVQISQLIVNLCRNAADSLENEPGNVTVELSRASRAEIADWSERPVEQNRLAVGKLDPTAEYARLRVSDDGAGIAPDVLKRIFDPFFTTKGRSRGTGLGLAVVHGVVETHGGACCVETELGHGTAFSVYLPLTNAPIADAGPPVRDRSPAGSERVLVVDDEPDIADMLVIGLERLGYDVVGTYDPVEALHAFEEDPSAWDAVIADQVMPAMLGTELLSRIKTRRPDLKTILCTGFAEKAESANSRCIDAFVVKPTDAQAIGHSLRDLFDRAPVS